MSNIFQPLVRSTSGVLPLNIGVGELVDPVMFQGLNLDATGSIYAVLNGDIDHYHNALPFNLHGRLVISNFTPERFDQGIGFTVSGGVSVLGNASYIDQGVAFASDGALADTATPTITIQPPSVIFHPSGDDLYIESAASNWVSMQWYFSINSGANWSPSGITTPTYFFANETAPAMYRAHYTNADGTTISNECNCLIVP